MLNFNDIHSLLLTHQGLFSLPYLPNFMLFLFFSHLKQTHLESSLRLPSPPGFQNFPSNLVETTTIIHLVTTDFPWPRSSPILTALGLWQWMECHLYHYFSVGEIFLSWNWIFQVVRLLWVLIHVWPIVWNIYGFFHIHEGGTKYN